MRFLGAFISIPASVSYTNQDLRAPFSFGLFNIRQTGNFSHSDHFFRTSAFSSKKVVGWILSAMAEEGSLPGASPHTFGAVVPEAATGKGSAGIFLPEDKVEQKSPVSDSQSSPSTRDVSTLISKVEVRQISPAASLPEHPPE